MKSGVRRKPAVQLFIPAIAFVVICCSSLVVCAQSAAELYNQAGQSYKSKQFRAAADDYEKLLSQGYHNAEIYYDLGNCYFKMDSVGKSILNYERGLRISPKDEDLAYNLKLAKLKSVDAIQPVPQLAIVTWWNDFISFNSSTGWGMYAVVTIWISILVFALSLFIGRRRILNVVAILFLLMSFSSVALAIHQHQQEEKSDAAVVMVPSAFVKSAPDAGASDLFMIHEGARIQLLDRVGDWNKIRLEDGKVGWIGKESFEKI